MLCLLISCDNSEKVAFPPDNSTIHVWVFLDVHCPLSPFYSNIINDYQKEFLKDSVIFYAVFPKEESNSTQVKLFAEKHSLQVKVVGDPELELSQRFNVTVVPEAFVTKDEEVLYRGKIDNSFEAVGERRCGTDQFYVKYALRMLAKQSNSFVKKTKPVGCIVK
ncbi:hypothetical protein GCM10011506_03580 [Marivirga lumbricoides]|uniref:Alkyl hydroperoxide reductase subunit C/ Thiol specific antioxidant domain-containing protein n=1 Tax=Marivirga lumbricoides TaxID=1046115 RepID=A0ABQ1LD81_9BACT|nr:hypothetical protein GCM10011506_03580 [Marivirga lumbricoides]